MTTTITAVTATIIKHCMLMEIEVNSTTTYYLSNAWSPITWDSKSYTQLGNFISMTELQDDLSATNNQLTITLGGIPTDDGGPNYMNLVLNTAVKGSRVRIYRAFFNLDTLAILPNQVYQRFNGYISNFALNENWDQENKFVSNTISIQCSSVHAILEKQFSGRRTNDNDQKYWFPSDTGMDKVKTISESSFDFGRPYSAPSSTSAPPADQTQPVYYDQP